MIDIFPLFLLRHSSNQASYLTELIGENNFTQLLNQYFDLLKSLSYQRELLCDEIFSVFKEIKDPEHKKRILNIKRDIFNGRTILDSDIELLHRYLGKHASQISSHYFKLCVKSLESKRNLSDQFISSLYQSRNVIKKLILNEQFQNGLLLSSKALLNEIDKYYLKPLNLFSKNELHSEVAFLKYITRMFTRTTPYGAFTNIAVEEAYFHSHQIASIVIPVLTSSTIKVNNFFIFWLKNQVLNAKDFYLHLEINLNLNLIKRETHYLIYSNIDNRKEQFHKIESDQTISLIIDFMNTTKKTVTLNYLIEYLSSISNLSSQKIENYLHNLLLIGFFELNLNPEKKDIDNSIDIAERFKTQILHKSKFVNQVIEKIETINVSKKYFGISTHKKRAVLLKNADDAVKDIVNLFQSRENLRNSTFQFDRDKLFKENIFYEDSYKNSSIKINKPDFYQCVKNIQFLIDNCLRTRYNYFDLIDATAFFITKYKVDEEVDLIEFFFEYQHTILRENQNEFSELEKSIYNKFSEERKDLRRETRRSWKESMVKTLKNKIELENSTLDLTKSDIINIKRDNQFSNKEFYSSSLLVFNRAIQGKIKSHYFLNGLTVGFGKTFSRFLNKRKTSKASKTQMAWNEAFTENDEILIENNDASYSNANIRSSLLSSQIRVYSSAKPKNNNVTLDRLKIIYNQSIHEIELIHKETGKKCRVLDLSLQAIEGRSEMFKFLSIFDILEVPLFDEFLEIINSRYRILNKIYQLPRINFESNLILQRRQWIIPKEFLPIKDSNIDDKTFFVDVNHWRVKLNIPDRAFVRLDRDTVYHSDYNRNYSKPQFIQFNSPILLRLFWKILQVSNTSLIIEEMLPEFDELLMNEDSGYFTEVVTQWTSESD